MTTTERLPMLSDEESAAYYDGDGRDPFISLLQPDLDTLKKIRPAEHGIAEGFRRGVKLADMYWRDKITSGELRVVKTVKCENEGKDEAWCEWLRCPDCNETTPVGSSFCPGCGSKIIAE